MDASILNLGWLLAEGAPAPGAGLQGMLPMILIVGVVYFMLLRPMSTQEKDRKKRVDGLKKGDEIVLGGGLIGRLSNTDDADIWTVEIADKVKVRVLRKDIVDSKTHALEEASRNKKK